MEINSLDPNVRDALYGALTSIRYAKSVITAYGKDSLYERLQKITAGSESPYDISVMGPRVMAVDDSPLIRDILRTRVQAHGFAVCDAADGAEAINKAKIQEPDLIILDFSMPVINGLEAREP